MRPPLAVRYLRLPGHNLTQTSKVRGDLMRGRSWLFWIVVVFIVIYIGQNPAQAGGQLRGAFESMQIFVSTTLSG